jgi:hypothetical protein
VVECRPCAQFSLGCGRHLLLDRPKPLEARPEGGAIRTETLPAFTEAEYRKIVAGLP